MPWLRTLVRRLRVALDGVQAATSSRTVLLGCVPTRRGASPCQAPAAGKTNLRVMPRCFSQAAAMRRHTSRSPRRAGPPCPAPCLRAAASGGVRVLVHARTLGYRVSNAVDKIMIFFYQQNCLILSLVRYH